jgi:hypothetical protein
MTSGFFPKWKLLSAIPNKEGGRERREMRQGTSIVRKLHSISPMNESTFFSI